MILLIKKCMLNNHKKDVINCSSLRTVTNVLVSDPTTGYAIFGDLMIKQMRATT